MAFYDAESFRTVGRRALVRMIEPALTTESGIYLPDNCRVNHSEAVVLKAAPGEFIPTLPGDVLEGVRQTTWCEEGDRVIFPPEAFQPISADAKVGLLDEQMAYGFVTKSDSIYPINGYVLLRPGVWRSEESGIVLPEKSRRRQDCGTVERVSVCMLKRGGSHMVGVLDRMGICAILGVSDRNAAERALVGTRVWFDKTDRVIEIGRERITAWLVHCEDICAWEGQRDAEGNYAEGQQAA